MALPQQLKNSMEADRLYVGTNYISGASSTKRITSIVENLNGEKSQKELSLSVGGYVVIYLGDFKWDVYEVVRRRDPNDEGDIVEAEFVSSDRELTLSLTIDSESGEVYDFELMRERNEPKKVNFGP